MGAHKKLFSETLVSNSTNGRVGLKILLKKSKFYGSAEAGGAIALTSMLVDGIS